MPRKKRRRAEVFASECARCDAALEFAREPEEVTLCDECADVVDASDAHWFVAHADPTFIVGSSDAAVLPPSVPPLGPSTVAADESDAAGVATARRWVDRADAVLVCAGAGMSRDSGLPDFRGRGGWYVVDGAEFSMAHMDFHADSPHWDAAWRVLAKMARAFVDAAPHAGYDALRTLAASKRLYVLSSNIDGFFERAGLGDAVYETHGTVLRLQCTTVGSDDPCASAGALVDLDAALLARLEGRYRAPGTVDGSFPLPRCACGAAARPNVSHETDADDEICATIKGAQMKRMRAWLRRERRRKSALAVVEIGCGTSVHSLRPDSEICVAAQHRAGGAATLLRIDPENCAVPAGPDHLGLKLGAREALGRLLD